MDAKLDFTRRNLLVAKSNISNFIDQIRIVWNQAAFIILMSVVASFR